VTFDSESDPTSTTNLLLGLLHAETAAPRLQRLVYGPVLLVGFASLVSIAAMRFCARLLLRKVLLPEQSDVLTSEIALAVGDDTERYPAQD